ncbi:hypothetical protein [Burkholderia cepacia]|uniref:hypothetical protein n=1 Tax=Burkholderia cepacia TaxID=292 RepID=UPI000A53390D|nr:hypothetical protein [Burkholderia cepacia]MCA8353790.1 hypothetical protein [Burkholderia cepacia]
MARKAQPKFPKKPPANPAVFFRPSLPGRRRSGSAAPTEITESLELMNLPHAH